MANQFRNDGEMPPEIAVQFPVDGKQPSARDKVKDKSKRGTSDYPTETSVWLDMVTGLICLVIAGMEVLAQPPETVPAKLLFTVGALVFLLLGLHFIGNGLSKFRQ